MCIHVSCIHVYCITLSHLLVTYFHPTSSSNLERWEHGVTWLYQTKHQNTTKCGCLKMGCTPKIVSYYREKDDGSPGDGSFRIEGYAAIDNLSVLDGGIHKFSAALTLRKNRCSRSFTCHETSHAHRCPFPLVA